MELFHVIDDGVVILRHKGGRYRQTKLYRRGNDLYAGLGSEFVRLLTGGGRTDPNVSWQGYPHPGTARDPASPYMPKWG
jgi:hypothetical protein